MAAGQGSARLAGLRHLEPDGSNREHVADADGFLVQSVHGEVLAEGARTHGPAELRLPQGIVRDRVHEERLVYAAVHLGVRYRVARETERPGEDRTTHR